MIYKFGRSTAAIYKGTISKQAAYWGLRLKWQNVRSCYGSGAWLNDRPWLNKDGWRNN